MTIANQQICCWSRCPDPQHPMEELYFRYCPSSCTASSWAIQKPLCQLTSRHQTEWLSLQGEQQQQQHMSRVNSGCLALFCFLPHSPDGWSKFPEGDYDRSHQFLLNLSYLGTCGCMQSETCLYWVISFFFENKQNKHKAPKTQLKKSKLDDASCLLSTWHPLLYIFVCHM